MNTNVKQILEVNIDFDLWLTENLKKEVLNEVLKYGVKHAERR